MKLLFKRLTALLTCVSLLLPTAVLAQCECCAEGCPAKSVESAEKTCCQTNSCCKAKHHSHHTSCDKEPCTAGSEWNTSCQCCDGQTPVETPRNAPTEQTEQQFDLLATSPAVATLPSHQELSKLGLPEGEPSDSSPLRLHAMLSVWLN